jgi:alpha/beta hydrolase fold
MTFAARVVARFLVSLVSVTAMVGCASQRAAPPAVPSSAAASSPPRFDVTLSAYAYPYPVHVFELRYGGETLRMAYLDGQAPKPNGRTVLLLHGKNFGAYYWAPTIKLLVGQGYRVIAPDQIGFGKSDKPRDYAYSFAALAANTRALLDSLGVQRAAVVGALDGRLSLQGEHSKLLFLTRFAAELVGVRPALSAESLGRWTAAYAKRGRSKRSAQLTSRRRPRRT